MLQYISKPFYKYFASLILLVCIIIPFTSNAQNCTVNAGIPESLCPGQAMVLKGKATGLFYSGGNAYWSQVAGGCVYYTSCH